ncbi:hypothetical protein GCK72_006503 [Caenorhabditis remanei]|uniref:F-box domain-containing protein n=1 Tax=Caenorhabditis remanei TaxID=31234 RepID=A0A6A5HIN1_CAERE|nr:hypothetical protein GCK72_006503 [Caenorhabditis remanei]KAF1766546.1 hypothetical protein GCK72_006503 [Caenorhabditis remanei]
MSSTSCRRLDDVALWSILKLVDAATLQNCRRVSTKWNGEIHRLSDYTSKFIPRSLIMELYGTRFKITVGTPNGPKGFEEDPISSKTVKQVFRHVDPPKTLLIFLSEDVDLDSYEMMMSGISDDWISGIRELEIVYHNPNLPFSKVLKHLEKTPNLTYLSLSHYCNETKSIGDIFEMLPELRYLRIFGFNSNDGSGCSSGLIFDDNAIEQLIKNQSGFRRIQNIELFNTDVTVSMDMMIHALRYLARLPIHSDCLQKSKNPEEVNLLFDNCRWDSTKELNLLASIIRISSNFNFPIQQPNENILKG